MKLCLGTVQFGGDYGIRGGKRPPVDEVVKMLDFATQNGVDAIDTAAAYGSAEDVVGAFLKRRTIPRERLCVVSKFGTDVFSGLAPDRWGSALAAAAKASLARLCTDYLDAFVCHVPKAAFDDAVAAAMGEVKKLGLARHVGVSVYETDEAFACMGNGACDFMQVPFSVLDQRMMTSGALESALRKGVIVHSRSAFVQGLVLMAESEVPERLSETRPLVRELIRLCASAGTSRRAMAMAFVRRQKAISHLVFGVDDLNQLKENIAAFSENVPDAALDEAMRLFGNVDPDLVMPNKWRNS